MPCDSDACLSDELFFRKTILCGPAKPLSSSMLRRDVGIRSFHPRGDDGQNRLGGFVIED
ncbi:hypothetical protein MUK42_13377 [Musa troglodytarum]|uniref:Uncharacterized protein n=1 Tax=Musa troglodytarum TaxID=320322 RepID=A0A9E7H0E7_9LILI|nr:hypothetical protein MUK42_13377 [Musa troglodytarum]